MKQKSTNAEEKKVTKNIFAKVSGGKREQKAKRRQKRMIMNDIQTV